MTGFLVAVICFFVFSAIARRIFWMRHAYAFAGHGHRGCGAHRGYGRGRWGRGPWGRPDAAQSEQVKAGFARAAAEVVKRRLRVDKDQEPVIDHALTDLRAALDELSKEVKATREIAAKALEGETVDEGQLAVVFARHDDAMARARREVTSAVKQMHAVLTPDQRKQAAGWVASGEGWA